MNQKSRKRWIIALSALLVLVFLIILLPPAPGGPVYQGKTTQDWAFLAQANDTNAAAAIRALGPDALPWLLKMLNTEDHFGKRHIAKVVNLLPAPIQRMAFLRFGPLDPSPVRLAAAHALGLLGPTAKTAVPELARRLHDPDPAVAWAAATALGRMETDGFQHLVAALQDKDPAVRLAAVSILGQLGRDATSAVPALNALLPDPDLKVRTAAASAVAAITPPYVQMLARVIENGEPQAQTNALQKLLDRQTDLHLVTAALHRMAQSAAPDARAAAIQALGRLPDDPLTLPALTTALEDSDPRVRLAGLEALGRLGPAAKPAAEHLRKLLQDTEEPVRKAAEAALQRIDA